MRASSTMPTSTPRSPALKSQDVLAGLGAAPRELLATCLALFEDNTLQQHLARRVGEFKEKWPRPFSASTDERAIASLHNRALAWMNASAHDDDLRLLLWMHLREAFDLPASTFGSLRSTRGAADDLVTAALASIQAGVVEKIKDWTRLGTKREIPDSLDALATQTLDELIKGVMQPDDATQEAARNALIQKMKERVAKLDPETQKRLLAGVKADELNDDAIRTLLLTGGGLTSFGTAVNIAGFSAYILAAQVSAFIPLVSGPALVSVVAVLSSPITIVLATVGAGWWAARSAGSEIKSAIALRVIALLALNGLSAGEDALRQIARAFARLPGIREIGTLKRNVLQRYQADWSAIRDAHRRATTLDPVLAAAMDRGLPVREQSDRWRRLLNKGDDALADTAGMGALTLGELLYNIHALDPAVLQAADFSRAADLADPVNFAAFAHQIETMADDSKLGAISNLKGYVAERVVASRLVDQGHVVSFPDLANQPGWDLEVDGIRFQIKNAADLSLLERHFEHYDYPVLANAEVADLLAQAKAHGALPAWADQVHFVEGYSQHDVQAVVDHSLAAGDGMLHPHVATFAVLLNAVRNVDRYRSGQMTGSQAVQDVIINGVVRTGLAVTGNYVGVGIGLLVFGPAGAVVLGSVLPVLSRWQSDRTKRVLDRLVHGERYRQWERAARQRLDALGAVLRAGLKEKTRLIAAREWIDDNAAAEYLAWRRDDDLRFLREAELKLKAILQDLERPVEEAASRLLVWLSHSTLHPARYQREFRAWLDVLDRRPGIPQSVGDLVGAITGRVRSFRAG
ncbi:MAG TPA: hypothetical protein VNK45_11415 [Candidatus Acidoferrales bacterium]|nr:hypothetical protein [Candidatus Acidoferrales bacterium]